MNILLTYLILIYGCTVSKTDLKDQISSEQAIEIAIKDFIKSNDRLLREDSVFSITIKDIDDNTIGISFFGSLNKYIVTENQEMDKAIFPTRFYEENKKLFLWKDSGFELNQELIIKLHLYNQIDSLSQSGEIIDIIDDGKKGMHYYFCKDDLSRFKKVKTNAAMGYYDPPKLKCN